MSLMRTANAALVALALAWAAAGDAHALQDAAEWIEALSPIHRGPPADDAPAGGSPASPPPATAVIPFADGTRLTSLAEARLDALASALTTARLFDYVFEIQWHATTRRGSADGEALADRRASALYEYLQAKPGISPGRVMIRYVKRIPAQITDELAADAVAIKVVNLGRED